jgi:serine/threonine-protein kinase
MTALHPLSRDGRPPVLGGRYEVGPLLGRGGVAEVRRGTDRLLDRPVAIKLVPGPDARPVDRDRLADADAEARLHREARAAAALNHPHVVAVYDIGWSGDSLFVVMEYLAGVSLAELVDREGALAVRRAVRLAEQVCQALAAAHDVGVIHRDVTPSNIMICPGDQAKLTDFGIARVTGAAGITATGLVVGTPGYMSPEQVEGKPVDARADLYSLGCCLYAMLTGQGPFHGESAVETACQHLRRAPTPPSAIRPDLPAGLEAAVLRAMAKRPDQRYTDAREMARELAAAVDEPARRAEALVVEGRGGIPGAVDAGARPVEELAEPDDGAARRCIGLALILLAVGTLLAIAVLLFYHRLVL